MSAYCVSIEDREYTVQITDSHLVVNGEPVEVDLVALNGQGLHLFRRGNCSQEVYFGLQAHGLYEVLAAGKRVIARVDSAHRRARRRRDVAAGDVVAPMPGLVVAVPVTEGDAVEAGQVLAVQEAMKMQMQLRAPFAGRVVSVAVAAGAQVDKGAVLVKVAQAGEG